jgi:hypothetical protein
LDDNDAPSLSEDDVMADDERSQPAQHYRHETEMLRAVVLGRSGVSAKRIPRVNIVLIESRRAYKDVPVLCPFIGARIPRLGQVVSVFFLNGATQRPYVIAHAYNLDVPGASIFADPLDPPLQYVDDQVYFHPETGAFIRFRNMRSSATGGGGDGRAGRAELTMASGASLAFQEYPQPEPPTPPTGQSASLPAKPNRATLTVAMPSGESIVFDEPEVGQSTMVISHPSGAKVTVDTQGNMILNTPGTLSLGAGGLDPDEQAVMTVAATRNMVKSLATVLTNYAQSSLQPGSGAPSVSLADVEIAGSSVVKAEE